MCLCRDCLSIDGATRQAGEHPSAKASYKLTRFLLFFSSQTEPMFKKPSPVSDS